MIIGKAGETVAFNLFGIPVRWYAIIIVTGIIIAVYLASREAKRVGISEDDIVDFMLYALPISIIGARIYYVIFELDYYLQYPSEIIKIWHGGLAIYGGLIAGGITLFVFCYYRGISFWKFVDVAAPSVLLAQGIGRWGNFINQEAYGPETTRQFLENIHLPQFVVDGMLINGTYHQPTFFYESIWSLLGFLIIVLLRKRPHFYKEGEIFCQYLIWYSFGRFFIEGLRTDSLLIFGTIRVSQLLSLVIFVVGIGLVIYRRRKINPPEYKRLNEALL